MSQVQTSFVTVTVTTISGTPVPTYNATQLAEFDNQKQTGQIIALVVLGLFGLLGLIMLFCAGILRLKRPPKPAMTENPDAVRHGRGAFLPVIGRKNRKSTFNSSNNASTVGLRGGGASMGYDTPQARRLSMWAEGGNIYPRPLPSPPLPPMQGRSLSAAPTGRIPAPHHMSRASSSNSVESIHSPEDGFATRYYEATPMEAVPLHAAPPRALPTIVHVTQSPRMEVARLANDDVRSATPISPTEEPFARGIPRYQHRGIELYDRAMYV